ncbi:ATP-binding protein [Pullulanibacillus sp. KACC 23026]|uniref:ATP-binding protein n=1 Tax=Pullulanibacillus sp. KACC 23026 TaxID=3028315 RepID=UPI0023B03298|nr:ATP-binding protein [Pullulanibacillus sp. KACC 23026]WEG12470.1 ATP-binding protein [Pullulanibacillus sp. KACC 23026]
MRRFLNLLKEKPKVPLKEDPISAPSLPDNISYDELIYRTKRGFLAKKLASYLEMDQKDLNEIYFLSLSENTFENDKSPYHQCIYCSECLLGWIKEGDEVQKKVDELPVNNQVKNAILKVYDLNKIHFKNQSVQTVRSSQNESFDKWKIYRDVIYSATQEKLLLISKEEAEALKDGSVIVKNDIKVISDIPKSRLEVKTRLEFAGYTKSELMTWLLVISEAITNTLKHAEEGKLTVIENQEKRELRVIVEDKGSGFDLENLPKATLMAGYSTKKSLGQGFQLMLKLSKQVLLYTSNLGSTIILTFETNNNEGVRNGTGG